MSGGVTLCASQRDSPAVGGWTNEQAGIRGSGDTLGAISHIKLSQGAFNGNPRVSLVPPVSLLVGFPEGVSSFRRNPRNGGWPIGFPSRSSRFEVRISWYQLFDLFVYFSRGSLSKKK